MVGLIARRLLLSIPLVLIVTGLTFVLLALIPGSAAESILGSNATPQSIEELEEVLGLNQPLYVQYWNWLSGVFRGDLGESIVDHSDVFATLMNRLGVTLSLLGGAMLVAIVLGVGIGVLTARRRSRWTAGVDVLAVVGLAVPSFVLALFLIYVFAVQLRWLPATGYVRPDVSVPLWAWFLVLPVVALSAHMVTQLAKQTRDSMLEALSAPYVTALRANGVRRRRIVYVHALHNASIPIVTVLGIMFVGSLTGALVAEQIFVLPGLGSAVVRATGQRDIPMIQGAALFLTLIVVAVNILIDLAYGALNPKVRAR